MYTDWLWSKMLWQCVFNFLPRNPMTTRITFSIVLPRIFYVVRTNISAVRVYWCAHFSDGLLGIPFAARITLASVHLTRNNVPPPSRNPHLIEIASLHHEIPPVCLNWTKCPKCVRSAIQWECVHCRTKLLILTRSRTTTRAAHPLLIFVSLMIPTSKIGSKLCASTRYRNPKFSPHIGWLWPVGWLTTTTEKAKCEFSSSQSVSQPVRCRCGKTFLYLVFFFPRRHRSTRFWYKERLLNVD